MVHKFFKHKTKTRGLNRELYFTKDETIIKIVDSLLNKYPILKTKKWIDPCAADGRWSNIIKNIFNINCENYDISPLNENVKYLDFLTSDFSNEKDLFFIGNPPYSLMNKFINKALSFSDYCYFLGTGARINKQADKVVLLHRFEGYDGNQKDLRSKCEFVSTNNEKIIVWTCGALFNNSANNNSFITNAYKNERNFAVGIYKFFEPDERVVIIKK